MASIKIPYLVEKPGRGGVPRFFWQPGRALRLAGWKPQRLAAGVAPDRIRAAAVAEAEAINRNVEAWRTAQAAGQAVPAGTPAPATGPAAGTIDALIEDFKASPRYFGNKKPGTQKAYAFCLRQISRWAGDKPARAITAAMVDDFGDALRAVSPAKANLVISVLRRLLSFAERYGKVGQNVARSPGLEALPFTGVVWPRAAVDAFVETADRLGMFGVGTAIRLNYWLGHNTIDVIRLRRDCYQDGAFRLERAKTGSVVRPPVGMIEEVSARLAAERQRQDDAGVTPLTLIVRQKTMSPYSQQLFMRDFNAVRDAVAAERPAFPVDGGSETVETQRLAFRHLRHTAVTRLAEAGCDLAEIAAISGHSLQTVTTILEHYLDRTRTLGESAFAKRLAKEGA